MLRGVAGVPDVRARLHGGDANGAWGGVVVAGVRPGGGERRAAFAQPPIWPSAADAMGSTQTRSGSTGRCLA